MKKRRILISVIIVAVLAAVTSLALYKFLDTNKNKSPGIITATEAEIMDIYLDMLIEHKKFADTIFTDTSNIMEGTGYFGKGGGQKIRTHNNSPCTTPSCIHSFMVPNTCQKKTRKIPNML